MPHYLVQATYTPEAWAALIKNPQNRQEAVRPTIERLGGRSVATYFGFGEYDIVSIFELPDNVTAAAFSVAVTATGAVKAIKTTPLLTQEEAVAFMTKAADVDYQPPG